MDVTTSPEVNSLLSERRQRRQEDSGRAGHGRPRRDSSVCQGFWKGRRFPPRRHRVLLGRTHGLDVRHAQSGWNRLRSWFVLYGVA